LSVRDLIGEVIGPDTFKRPKPDPVGLVSLMQRYQVAEDKMVMIGDTEIDIKTAHQAGVTAVAVTYGYRTQAQLASENPHFYLAHPQEIHSVSPDTASNIGPI
jgi:phosphoglycolate phosphatase